MSANNNCSEPDDCASKCIRCAKVIPTNAIGCDKCEGWLHIRCAGLKLKEFEKMCDDKDSTFVCRYCQYYECGKCSKPVYPVQNGVKCDIDACGTWFHLRCTHFTLAEYLNKKSRLHTDPWYCPPCVNLPFSSLSQRDFSETVKDDLDLRSFYKSVPNIKSFKTKCSVCTRKITNNQNPKCLPCSDCKSLVHRKCSNISLPDLLNCKPSQLKQWSCNTCMSGHFPFQGVAAPEVQKLTYNSLVYCPCLDMSEEVPVGDDI